MTQALVPGELWSVFDRMREGLQILDREWRYVYVNEAAASQGGVARVDLIGRKITECFPTLVDTPLFAVLRGCMEQRRAAVVPTEFTFSDGRVGSFEVQIQPCGPGLVVLSTDVTQSRLREAQLRQAQRLETVGRLVSGIAHDFGNLLSVVLSYSSMLAAELRPSDPVRSDVLAIQRASEQAAMLTRQLLAFGRQQPSFPRVVDLNEVVLGAETLLRRALGEELDLVLQLARDLGRVLLDPAQLEQCLLHVAITARECTLKGGRLTLRTRNVSSNATQPRLREHARLGPQVLLELTVEVFGSEAEVAFRWDTFVKPNVATSEALASDAFEFVQQAGGAIDVAPEPGGPGSCRLFFPRTQAPLPTSAAAAAAAAPRSLRGTETVLLVEDQADVRAVVRDILRRQGYTVLEARDAGEALLLGESHNGIDLLLTDVVMPKVTGRELADRLLKLRPGLPVLYMSGFTDSVVVQHALLDAGDEYLQKPIVPNVLALRVREVLDARGARPEPR